MVIREQVTLKQILEAGGKEECDGFKWLKKHPKATFSEFFGHSYTFASQLAALIPVFRPECMRKLERFELWNAAKVLMRLAKDEEVTAWVKATFPEKYEEEFGDVD
jgi:hypothetical protein